MTETGLQNALEPLDVFVGEWNMSPSPAGDAGGDLHARTTFEWLTGGHFLVQRWEVEYPEVPDGIAIIGFDTEKSTYRQHYFDSRGVARVYEMDLAEGVGGDSGVGRDR